MKLELRPEPSVTSFASKHPSPSTAGLQYELNPSLMHVLFYSAIQEAQSLCYCHLFCPADRCLLVNLPSQPPWKDAEPLQGSALLGRLQSFLPAMQKANQELEQAAAEEQETCNIENVAEGTPHIEMNLACGVLDLKDSSAAAAAQRAVNLPKSAEAMEQLPVLKEGTQSNSNPISEGGVLDMSRVAATVDGSMMSERASRHIGKAEQESAEPDSMHKKASVFGSPRGTDTDAAAISDPQHTSYMLSTSEGT